MLRVLLVSIVLCGAVTDEGDKIQVPASLRNAVQKEFVKADKIKVELIVGGTVGKVDIRSRFITKDQADLLLTALHGAEEVGSLKSYYFDYDGGEISFIHGDKKTHWTIVSINSFEFGLYISEKQIYRGINPRRFRDLFPDASK